MSQYAELVKALRCCGNVNTDCTVCPWDKYNFGMCAEKLLMDAAAAIEELQALLTEADKKQAYQHDCICELTAENEELKADVGKWQDIAYQDSIKQMEQQERIWELEAELEPKRGKMYFLEYDNPETGEYEQTYFQCSVCGKYFYGIDECEAKHFNYCPNCGAKMEVQDADT